MIYQVSGFLQLNPDPFTMRELWWMFEGKQDQDWQHTSAMMAMNHNLQCSKKSQQKPPAFFNPILRAKPKERLNKEQTKVALKQFLSAATKGKFKEQNVRYVLKDGAYVIEHEETTKEVN